MGLVSMILERRERDYSCVADPMKALEAHMSAGIQTRSASPDDTRAQEAISLTTFAMRIDSRKRRAQKLG